MLLPYTQIAHDTASYQDFAYIMGHLWDFFTVIVFNLMAINIPK